MFNVEVWKEIFSSLKSNVLRTVLTASIIIWGIYMLIVMSGAGKGMENGMKEGVGKFATNSFLMWTERTGEPYAGFRRGRRWSYDNSDVDYIRNRVEGVDIAAPRLFGGRYSGNNTVRGERSGSYNIKGDYPDWGDIDPSNIPQGRWLNEIDIQYRRKVCVVGKNVVEELFDKEEDPIGEYIRINNLYYKIVGVLEPISNININGRKEESIFIPFSTMQLAYNMGNEVHIIGVVVKDGYSATEVETRVIAAIKERNKIAPSDMMAVGHVNLEKQFKLFFNLFYGIQILTWIVGIGTLLAGVLGVSNIMLIVIKERTKEIGVMRAIGATPRKVINQIMLESTFLTTVAGYIGLFLGVLTLEGINSMLRKSAENGSSNIFMKDLGISLEVAMLCLAILIVAGIIAGYMPARHAVKVKPIDALRD